MVWAPDYVTPAELKAYLRIDDPYDDPMISMWISTASRAVDDFCGRQFGKVTEAEARTYRMEYDRHLTRYGMAIDDLFDVTDLVVEDARGNEYTGYVLGPVNAPAKGRPYERVSGTRGGYVTITGLWGWPSVPAAVKNATLIQAARLAARRDSPYGIAGSPSEGSEIRLLASLDPDLRTSLGRTYRRVWWAA